MKTEKPVVFTRVMYCETCYKNKLPQKGGHFLVFGGDSQELSLHKVTKDHTHFGYLPHIITVDEILKDGRFKLHVSCSYIGCGWILKPDPEDDENAIPDCIEAHTIILEALEYAALKNYKDETYNLD